MNSWRTVGEPARSFEGVGGADVNFATDVGEGTLEEIRRNLSWALAYDNAMIPPASLGPLEPGLAAGAMALSSVSVPAGSLLFRRYAPDEEYRLLYRRR